MLDQVLRLFDIRPDIDLALMRKDQDLFDVTANALLALRDVYREVRPDIVLVQGDTTTCMSAALAAFYARIPIGHIEAGLRTFDLQAPFPEEGNRCIVSRITDLHFPPTRSAAANLLREGVPEERVLVTGNTVIDALLSISSLVERVPPRDLKEQLDPALVAAIDRAPERVILITGHRRENFGGSFRNICEAIKDLALRHPGWLFVYPVHLNPNVREPVFEILAGADNVLLVEPMEYLSFVWLMKRADLILTDSGGIQEEAPSLGKPVLVMREKTERPEAVDAGTVRLVGADRATIIRSVEEVLLDSSVYQGMARAQNPYGDGHAAERIVAALRTRLPQ
jgi:UDP-N-acetylglucosamine 2-epimerase (non-hydrolysing)